MKHVAITSAACTHPGRHAQNEDAILARDDIGLWAVADGMGGHHGGSWAAATMMETLARLADAADATASGLDRALAAGNAEIVAAARETGGTIGTTVAALAFDGYTLNGAWVGDSRIYRWRTGRLEPMTRDHSVLQELVDRGTIGPDEAEDHPLSHVLSRALGTAPEPQAERFAVEARPGDLFLLCSDGLTRVVAEAEIGLRLATCDPHDAVDALLQTVLDRGAPDDVSIIVVRIDPVLS